MKICSICNIEKDYKYFNKDKSNKDGYRYECAKCQNLLGRTQYLRKTEYVFNYLSSHPCIDCGETNILVLDFDHVKGIKIFTIGVALYSSISLQRIIKEIEKCEVRCANCHRIQTARRKNSLKYRFLLKIDPYQTQEINNKSM